MVSDLLLSVIVALISCMQIHLYTPFKSRAGMMILGVFFFFVSAITFMLYKAELSVPLYILGNILLALLGCIIELYVCKTTLFCGVYNVIIQLCINRIAFFLSHSVLRLTPVAGYAGAVISDVLCLCFCFVWYLVMLSLRRDVWVRMPMPDQYYRPVAFLITLNYFLTLSMFSLSAVSELIVALCSLLGLGAILLAIRMPQYVLQEQEQSSMIAYQQKAMRAYVSGYERTEEKLRTIRHDIKHMVNTVNELLEHNEVLKAQEIAHQMSRWLEKSGHSEYSDNVLLNAILEDYALRFAANNIPFEISVKLTGEIFIPDLEFTTLLHNILSNAWEYCSSEHRTKAMSARIQISTNRNYLFINCQNPLEDPPKLSNGRFLSQKEQDVLAHGIGIESIKETVSKYEGELRIQTENHIFRIEVMLLNKEADNSISAK